MLNFWNIFLSIIPTQSTAVPERVLISTTGWENREKVLNELLPSFSAELEISGVSSLQLLMIVHLWILKSCIIGNIHWPHVLFTVVKKHLLRMGQPLNDSLTFWLALCLQMKIDSIKWDAYYLLLQTCSKQFSINFRAMNSKFHLEFHFKMQVIIGNILSSQERSWLGVYVDTSPDLCTISRGDVTLFQAFPRFQASPSLTSSPQSPQPHLPKRKTAKLK